MPATRAHISNLCRDECIDGDATISFVAFESPMPMSVGMPAVAAGLRNHAVDFATRPSSICTPSSRCRCRLLQLQVPPIAALMKFPGGDFVSGASVNRYTPGQWWCVHGLTSTSQGLASSLT